MITNTIPILSYEALANRAAELVRFRIAGHRKGLPDTPNHLHSFRVLESLQQHDVKNMLSSDTKLGALLHDIVEDGGVSLNELTAHGFSSRTVELVSLCSHMETSLGKEARWTLMIARLIQADDRDAWMIKIADLLDNLKESRGLTESKRRFMIEVKAQLMLRLTANLAGDTSLWRALEEEAELQKSLFQILNT